MKKISLLLVFVLSFILFSFNQSYTANPGTTSAAFLKIGVGARNISMGETGAISDDINAIYWNPAGLVQLKSPEVSFMHAAWFETIKYEHLAFGYPIKIGTLACGINYLSMSPIEKYDNMGMKVDKTYSPSDTAVTVSYARNLGKIPVGLNLRFISSKIDNKSAGAYACDIGGIYNGLQVASRTLQIGLVLQNLGTKMKFEKESDPLPMNIKVGSKYKLVDNKLTLALDINKPIDNDIRINFGTEYVYKFNKDFLISGRAGYKTNTKGLDTLAGLSVGMGFGFRKYSIDYAWVPYGDLGQTHRFSILVKF